jgi:hypothetical protein
LLFKVLKEEKQMRRIYTHRIRIFWCLAAVFAIGIFQFAGNGLNANAQKIRSVTPETTTPQSLPFSQNWTNVGLITADDTWTGVPGVVGYRGDDLTAATGTDPRTILADGSGTPQDVNANHADPDTFITGGVTEFDGIANPTVALQGSGTADAPHLVFYLNTTGQSNIQFSCNIRDIDNSADNSTQQIDVQYRTGGAGSYTSVTGGYIADASSGPSTTMSTPLNLTLPAAADNQAIVEVRVITTNAIGNDEWIGVDDVSVTGTPVVVNTQHTIDFNGDGKTDWNVVRNTGGGPGGQLTWFTTYNGGGGTQTNAWGLQGDEFTPGDYDGDNKTDVSIWRAGAPGVAGWYTLLSATAALRADTFGQTGDDPSVLGDYNGDGKDDIAVYRAGAVSGAPSFWYWRTVVSGPVFNAQWGQNGDFPVPGDFDNDGKNDFVVQRNAGGGQARFWRLFATGSSDSFVFGTPTDVILPGDYDGDGKTDIAVVRSSGGQILWNIHPSGGGADTATLWGTSASDFPAPGDYDGDGKTDLAVWRPSITPGQSSFLVTGSTSGFIGFTWGQNGDYPVANFNNH